MSIRKLWIVLFAVFLSLETYWISVKRYEAQGVQPFEHDYGVPLQMGRVVGQTFLGHGKNLTRIRLFIGVPEGSEDTRLEFHLQRAGREGKEYWAEEWTAEKSGWVDFRFPPIADSAGFAHHFFVVAIDPSSSPVLVAVANGSPYPDGNAYAKDLPKESDLRFELYYTSTVFQKLDDVLDGKPYFFGSKSFLIAVWVFYNLGIALFFHRLFTFVWGDNPDESS